MPARDEKRIKSVLFDLDGVLVQTEELKAEAHAAATRQLGRVVPASLYRQFLGMSHNTVRDAFLAAAGIEGAADLYTEYYRRAYAELLAHRLEPAPGAQELVLSLVGQSYRLAVVTSSNATATGLILQNIGLESCFQVCITADDVKEAKPAPDAYLLALRRLGVSRRAAVVLEDSETGVEAARRAGIPAIAIRHSWNTSHDFSGAVAEFESLREPHLVVAAIARTLQAAGEAVSDAKEHLE